MHRGCEAYLRRAEEYRRRAEEIGASLVEDGDGGKGVSPYAEEYSATTASLLAVRRRRESLVRTREEYVTLEGLHRLNYRYCLGHGACPKRTEALHRCWNGTTPRLSMALLEVGKGGWICREEKLAVERCCGELVQGVVGSALEY